MLIKRPIVTEKSVKLNSGEVSRYTFETIPSANKTQIKKNVEKMFGVKVEKVQTLNMPGKKYRSGKKWIFRQKSDWKKAIVPLKPGQKIEQLEVTGGGKE